MIPGRCCRLGSVAFTSQLWTGGLVYAELLSHLGLEQTEVEPALAEVVAYRNELSRIGLRWWLGRLPV